MIRYEEYHRNRGSNTVAIVAVRTVEEAFSRQAKNFTGRLLIKMMHKVMEEKAICMTFNISTAKLALEGMKITSVNESAKALCVSLLLLLLLLLL